MAWRRFSLAGLAVALAFGCVSPSPRSLRNSQRIKKNRPMPGYENYRLVSLKQAQQLHTPRRNTGTLILPEGYPFRSHVVFTGEWRHISDRSIRMLKLFTSTQTDREKANEFVASFRSEIKVVEGKKHYWLPVQESLIADIDRFVKANKRVDIYCLLLGSESTQWTAVVNALAPLPNQSIGLSQAP